MVMFVPEGRDEITTEGGLNVKDNAKRLSEMIKNLKENGIIASVFIDADLEQAQKMTTNWPNGAIGHLL